ncbi:hypothetical protein BDI4_300014 [Burkholderia diffusa]|nr:hypothetical protein BDI4_300014 [Burkholderia diffusa]
MQFRHGARDANRGRFAWSAANAPCGRASVLVDLQAILG